jgi:hypothetical protein
LFLHFSLFLLQFFLCFFCHNIYNMCIMTLLSSSYEQTEVGIKSLAYIVERID